MELWLCQPAGVCWFSGNVDLRSGRLFQTLPGCGFASHLCRRSFTGLMTSTDYRLYPLLTPSSSTLTQEQTPWGTGLLSLTDLVSPSCLLFVITCTVGGNLPVCLHLGYLGLCCLPLFDVVSFKYAHLSGSGRPAACL